MVRTRAICMMALVLTLVAGVATAGPLGKGVKVGLNYSQTTDSRDGVDDSDRKLGLAAGISMSYKLIPGLSIQPELLYVQGGGKYDVTDTDGGSVIGTGELIQKLDYLQIPVLARIDVPVLGAVLPTVMAGGAVSYLLNAESELDLSSGSTTTDIGDDFKSIDLSLIFGLGFKLGAGPAGVSVDLRYVHGLTDINDRVTIPPTDQEIKNRSIQVLAGVSF